MTGRPALPLAAAAVLVAATPPVCAAQLAAALDAGASYVRYDGFLGSAAVSITPTVTYRGPRASLGGRGTVLVFESGNTSVQGLLSGGLYSPPLGPARVEAVAEAGGAVYARFGTFAHRMAALRVHVLSAERGLWAGPLVGRIEIGGTRAVAGAGAGTWSRVGTGAVSVTVSRATVGDTSYSDAEGRLRFQPGRLDVEGTLGARFASAGAGHGVYGDLSATVRLEPRVKLVIAAGRYPSDPMRGSIPGAYLTLGLRMAPRPAPRPVTLRGLSWRAADAVARDAPATLSGARLVVERLDGLLLFTLHAPGAARVELMGDFTDWQPIALTPAGAGRHEFAVRLATGLYRFNVRIDGGAWGVPRGADVAEDEFGGHVGVLVVP